MSKKRALRTLSAELQSMRLDDSICITTGKIEALIETISYQLPLKVTEYTAYATVLENVFDSYEICPKCGLPLTRTYQQHCDKCGQSLQWISRKCMSQRY